MEAHEIQQTPGIAKISKSALQFRELIESLRSNLKANRPPKQPLPQKIQVQKQKDSEAKDESTLVNSQNKVVSANNNFLLHNQSQDGLRLKQKMEVGDRDKLKKKPFVLDSNPELQYSHSKAISKLLENSTQHIEAKHINELNTRITHKAIADASTQYQAQSPLLVNSVVAPRNNYKVGQILKQNFKITQNQIPAEEIKKIKDINENLIIEYCKKEKQISQKSTPSQIFSFFASLVISCGIVIRSPFIKKYKNCIYFGFYMQRDLTYEGFLYFYDGKIYYGQFYNGFKHGLGVEINFAQHTRMKGEFKEGHKTGKFYIERPTQRYVGFLENGLYQGEGRLTKEDYVYQGMFDKGQKNGYGEEYYPKTGVRITGIFNNGVLQKTKASKSIPEIKTKSKSFSLNKEKDKDRLELIRKKSLQKHNFRMNKIKDRSFRDNDSQMQFQVNEANQNRLHYNSSKLEVYRQPIHKFPKICNQFEFTNEIGHRMDSISSQHDQTREYLPTASKPRRAERQVNRMQRVATNQLQQPLPAHCFTVLRGRK